MAKRRRDERTSELVGRYSKYDNFKQADKAMKEAGLKGKAVDAARNQLKAYYKEKETAAKEEKKAREAAEKEAKAAQKKAEKEVKAAQKKAEKEAKATEKKSEKEGTTKEGTTKGGKPAHWTEYEAKGDSKVVEKEGKEKPENLLESVDKSIIIGEDGKMTFHKRTKDKDGKIISEDFTRNTTKQTQEGANYTLEDITTLISKIAEENKKGKMTMTFATGEPVVISMKKGKVADSSLKAINKALAQQTKVILPPEKEISQDKKGWFEFKGQKLDKDGKVIDVDSKTQLAKDKREGFVNEEESTTYYNIKGLEMGDTTKKEVVKEKKTGIPKWVKAVAIGGAVVAGVTIATGLCAPIIMPAVSTLWHAAPAHGLIRAALHGVNVGLAGLNSAVTFGTGGLAYTAGTGIWTSAAGIININAASAGLGSAVTALLGSSGLIASAGAVGGKLMGKLLNTNKKEKEEKEKEDKEKDTPEIEDTPTKGEDPTPKQPDGKDDKEKGKDGGKGPAGGKGGKGPADGRGAHESEGMDRDI